MINQALIDQEWEQVSWGNYQANIEFLSLAKLDQDPRCILEIGCGKGAILEWLQRAGHSVHGVDINPEAIAECNAAHPDIPATGASGDRLPFSDSSFDLVLSLDVFEHIRDSDLHLREVTRVLKPGGTYLLQTPNKWTNIPFEILRQWKKFHTGPLKSYRDLMLDHCALHNYWQLKRRFHHAGYRIAFVTVPVVNNYFRSKMRTYLGPMAPALLAVANPDRFPIPLKTNFYVRAERL